MNQYIPTHERSTVIYWLCLLTGIITRINGIVHCVPLATEPSWLADRCSMSQQLGTLQTHSSSISLTTNIPLFKFRCNIFIGVRIIKEMPGSVASGTHCSIQFRDCFFFFNLQTGGYRQHFAATLSNDAVFSKTVW
jgi:hypothetical protein